jgi:hypothetical protein
MNIENVTAVAASIVAVGGALSAIYSWSYRRGRASTRAEADEKLGQMKARLEDLKTRLAALEEEVDLWRGRHA